MNFLSPSSKNPSSTQRDLLPSPHQGGIHGILTSRLLAGKTWRARGPAGCSYTAFISCGRSSNPMTCTAPSLDWQSGNLELLLPKNPQTEEWIRVREKKCNLGNSQLSTCDDVWRVCWRRRWTVNTSNGCDLICTSSLSRCEQDKPGHDQIRDFFLF